MRLIDADALAELFEWHDLYGRPEAFAIVKLAYVHSAPTCVCTTCKHMCRDKEDDDFGECYMIGVCYPDKDFGCSYWEPCDE